MKWIGQHIYDYISRFRNDVYLESISSGTIASGGNLGLDSNNKIVKATISSGGISHDGSTADGVLTYKDADEATVEQYLTFANADNTSTLSLLSSQDTGDLFKIETTTHGATTLTTVDDDATAAHLTFTADGDLKSQPRSGLNYWYKGGNADDYLKLEIGANGEATFTTVDAAATAADMTFTPDGDFLVNSDSVKFISDQANDPLVQIRGEANDATGPRLRLMKTRGEDGQANDVCGTIQFYSYDDGTPSTHNYAQIQGTILHPAGGEESGKLTIGVSCAFDGAMEDGLVLSSGDADGEVDATIGSGAASVTTVAGTLTMGSTAAMTNAGLLSVANQTGITGVGTISSGVWNGTAITTTYTQAKVTSIVAGDGIDVSGATGDVTVTAETASDSNPGVVELATTGEADTGTDETRVVTPAGLKSHVDTYARKCILRAGPFYINDDPFVQNSLYFGHSLGSADSNWNDPQATGGTISSVSSFTIAEDDMNWGYILPFNISKIEIQCSLRPAGGGTVTGNDFTIALYTSNRSDASNTVITLTKVAHAQDTFSNGNYTTNDLDHTANLNKGTMIFVGVGSEDSTAAKNARGILNITVTER